METQPRGYGLRHWPRPGAFGRFSGLEHRGNPGEERDKEVENSGKICFDW